MHNTSLNISLTWLYVLRVQLMKFEMHQWYGPITLLFNKMDMYKTSNTVIGDRSISIAIRELCNVRDGIDHLPFATNYIVIISYSFSSIY